MHKIRAGARKPSGIAKYLLRVDRHLEGPWASVSPYGGNEISAGESCRNPESLSWWSEDPSLIRLFFSRFGVVRCLFLLPGNFIRLVIRAIIIIVIIIIRIQTRSLFRCRRASMESKVAETRNDKTKLRKRWQFTLYCVETQFRNAQRPIESKLSVTKRRQKVIPAFTVDPTRSPETEWLSHGRETARRGATDAAHGAHPGGASVRRAQGWVVAIWVEGVGTSGAAH